MCDIMMSIAYECGDKDCKQQWHKASYWTADDGYTVDWYSDGDHESVSEDELPSADEERASWRQYSAYVAQTGDDPLEEFFIKHSTKVNERWAFKFSESILGPVIVEARRGRKPVLLTRLPEHIVSYLNLDKGRRKLGDFATWSDLEAAVPGVKPHRWQRFSIEHQTPRSPAAVKRELVAAAKRHLRS